MLQRYYACCKFFVPGNQYSWTENRTHQPTLVLGGMVLIAAAAYGTSLLVTLFEGKLCPWKRTIENL